MHTKRPDDAPTYRPLQRSFLDPHWSHHREGAWQDQDHLLLVTREFFVETYKRVYLDRLQAVVVQKTRSARILSLLLLGATLLFAALYARSLWTWDASSPAQVAFSGLSAFFAFFLIVNILLGPSCRLFLLTAVHTQELRWVTRLRPALRLAHRIADAVKARQGIVDGSHLAVYEQRLLEARTAPSPTTVARQKPPRPVLPPLLPGGYKGRAHHILVAILLLDLWTSVLQFYTVNMGIILLSLGTGFAMITLVVIALIRQYRSTLSLGLKTLPWLTLAYLAAAYLIGSAQSTFIHIHRPDLQSNYFAYLRHLAKISPWDSTAQMVVLIFSIVCSGSLSIFGLIQLKRHAARCTPAVPAVANDAVPPARVGTNVQPNVDANETLS